MFTADEISRSASGAWALFKGDPQGLRALDASFAGFWRSFGVILLLLPAVGILIASERMFLINQLPVNDATFPSATFVWSRLFGFAIGWIDYALVLALLAGPLGLAKRYVPLIVALNWTSLIAAVPTTFPHLLHVLGLAGDEMTSFLSLFALGAVLRYQYMVTRFATGAQPGFCVGLVALDFVLGLALGAAITAATGI